MSDCQIVGGLPVPKIVCRQMRGHHELVPCEWPHVATLMTRWVGESGPPDFGKYDDDMHRRCIMEEWCHVCGRGLKHLLICCPKRFQFRMVDGKPEALLVQPWVCCECLAFACITCPPLTKVIADGQGQVVNIRDWEPVATSWKPATPEDPTPPEGTRVLSMFKVMPIEFTTQPLPAWNETIGRKLRRKMASDAPNPDPDP